MSFVSRFFAAAATAAGLLLCVQPAIAAESIVSVEGCATSAATTTQTISSPFGGSFTQLGTGPMVMIAYSNKSTKPISSIIFGVVSNGKVVDMFRDQGNFTTGAVVMHAFGIKADLMPAAGSKVSCEPLAATFTDGSKWQAPVMPNH